MNSTEVLMSHKKETRRPSRRPGRTGPQTVCQWSTL